MVASHRFWKFLVANQTKLLLIPMVVIALGTLGIIPSVSVALIGHVNVLAAVPPNFTRVTVISNLTNPVQTRFAPNGDMYIAEQCGTIRLYHNGALVPTPVIAIPNTQCDNERGLLGIALDGNFATNGYLYAGYTNTDGHSRLSRFTVVSGVANPNTETILYKFVPSSAIYHNINDVEWGPDGKLWVESGDGYTCGSACGTEAQNLSSPLGKLLRFNPDGSAPTDNPFYGQPAPQSYIWAMGFRSNFRMTFMANGTPMVGDVGVHTPVEDKWQRFYLIAKPNGQQISNEGWSSFEYHAPCTSPSTANANPNNGETNCPFYEYQNNPSPSAANAITGFLQYEGNAYPASYKNVLFYGEYGSQTIHYLTFTDSTFTQVASDTIFDGAANTTVDLEVGPDGDLYSTSVYSNAVYKYVYTLSSGTPTPTPVGGQVQLSNLSVADTANAASWSIQQNIQVGDSQYGDRGYTLTSVPASLAGSTWIRTANGSKTFTGNPTVTFDINQPATIYVAIDNRLSLPAWMDASWTNTGLTLTNSEATPPYPQTLFAKAFPVGAVSLGPVSNNPSNTFLMYTVIAAPGGAPPTPTPTPTSGPPTPTPTSGPPTPTPTPVSGPVQLSNLKVADTANAAKWSLQTNLQVGAVQYGDRSYTLATIPASLIGSAWVRSANTSKAYTGTPTVTFTINQSATVYVVLDTRVTTKPSWLDATWKLTGLTLSNNETAGSNAFVIYSKTFPAGQVALGPNDNGSTGVNMYTVIVQ
jgi:glucose/arabinose dehydrogenase